jgi:hypothetical protein
MALAGLARSVRVVDNPVSAPLLAPGAVERAALFVPMIQPKRWRTTIVAAIPAVFRVHFVKLAGKAPKENNGYFVCGIQILEHSLHDMASNRSSHSVIIGKVRAGDALFSPTFILSTGLPKCWASTSNCVPGHKLHRVSFKVGHIPGYDTKMRTMQAKGKEYHLIVLQDFRRVLWGTVHDIVANHRGRTCFCCHWFVMDRIGITRSS